MMTLTKTRLGNGIWEGELTGAGDTEPQLQVTHQGAIINGLGLEQDQVRNAWRVTFTIPAEFISDGVQTFIIGTPDGTTLASIALLAGDALAEDIRAEMNLMRDELDMLKKAFRQHCQNS